MQSEKNDRLGDKIDFGGSYTGSYHLSPEKISVFNFVFNVIVLIFMFLVLVYIAYLIIWPIKVVTWHTDKIEVGLKTVQAGKVLPLKYSFTKHVDEFPTIHTRLIDTISYQLPEYKGSTGVGKSNEWRYNFIVPYHLPPGKYKIERIWEFNFNPLHNIRYRLMSEEFEVTK